mmetsp:Transcript_21224/g.49046  ORF Transcript_21224/g.49046 Transcript_21224/m.49046 type:complete len:115 (+) Transcript_21224:1-345(+)
MCALVIPLLVAHALAVQEPLPKGKMLDSRMGAAIGLMMAAAVAVAMGFVLERQLSDRRFLLVAWVALGSLCLASLCDAMGVYLAKALADTATEGRQAMLSFLALSATPHVSVSV